MVYISTFKSRAGSLRMTQQPNGSLISMARAQSVPGILEIAHGRGFYLNLILWADYDASQTGRKLVVMTMSALKQQTCTDCNCISAFGPRRALARWSGPYRKPTSALNGQAAGHRLQKGRTQV